MSENNNQVSVPQKRSLPKLSELHFDPLVAFKNDDLKLLLNQKPNPKWLKKHPLATKKIIDADGTKKEVAAEYLPIDKIEFWLDYIFQEWKIEVLNAYSMFHSVCVTVRVHYISPVTGQWMFHDGVGAVKAQSDKEKPFSADTIKANAVQIGLPAAKSYAIKDACEHLGELFGRNINRADVAVFQAGYDEVKPKVPEDKTNERLAALLDNCKTRKELEKFQNELITPEHRTKYDELWKKLK